MARKRHTAEEIVSMQDVFLFEKRGVTLTGKVLGRFYATGVVPKFAERFKASGLVLPPNFFEHSYDVL